jgi:hypothetical protein
MTFADWSTHPHADRRDTSSRPREKFLQHPEPLTETRGRNTQTREHKHQTREPTCPRITPRPTHRQRPHGAERSTPVGPAQETLAETSSHAHCIEQNGHGVPRGPAQGWVLPSPPGGRSWRERLAREPVLRPGLRTTGWTGRSKNLQLRGIQAIWVDWWFWTLNPQVLGSSPRGSTRRGPGQHRWPGPSALFPGRYTGNVFALSGNAGTPARASDRPIGRATTPWSWSTKPGQDQVAA